MRPNYTIDTNREQKVNSPLDTETESLTQRVFDKLGLRHAVLLGRGGEALVYEYGSKVLKIFPKTPDLQYLYNLQLFQQDLAAQPFTFKTPVILEIDNADGVVFTIEDRLRGMPMDQKLAGLNTADRQKVFASYYQAIRQVHQVKYPDLPYGHIIQTPQSLTASSWVDFLSVMLDQQVSKTKIRIKPLVTDFDSKLDDFHHLIQSQLTSSDKTLVHRDYYHNNCLVGDNLAISAILDFSSHAVVGDPRMDIASVLTWNEINPVITPNDYDFLFSQAEQDYGTNIRTISDLYLMYSAFYFSDMADLSFSVSHLNNAELWKKISD